MNSETLVKKIFSPFNQSWSRQELRSQAHKGKTPQSMITVKEQQKQHLWLARLVCDVMHKPWPYLCIYLPGKSFPMTDIDCLSHKSGLHN